MKISIEAKTLAKGMKNAASLVQNAAIIPIFACVRLTARDGELTILSSDLDTEYRQVLPLEKGDDLDVAVDAKRLAAIAGSAGADAVLNMSLGDGRLTVTAKRSRWVLPVLPANDFPTMPADDLGPVLAAHGALIAKAIRRVEWSVYAGSAQMHLQGIYLHDDAGKARMAAANGNTLAIANIEAPFPADHIPAMLPTKYAATLASLSEGFDGDVSLAWDDRKIRAVIGDVILTGKLMDSAFVDYRRVVPAAQDTPVAVNPDDLTAALKRVQIVADDKSRCVRMQSDGGLLRLIVSEAGGGMSEEDLPADGSEGLHTGINGQYLAQLMAAIGGEAVEIHQAETKAPILFRRRDNDDAMAVVMPMRI